MQYVPLGEAAFSAVARSAWLLSSSERIFGGTLVQPPNLLRRLRWGFRFRGRNSGPNSNAGQNHQPSLTQRSPRLILCCAFGTTFVSIVSEVCSDMSVGPGREPAQNAAWYPDDPHAYHRQRYGLNGRLVLTLANASA